MNRLRALLVLTFLLPASAPVIARQAPRADELSTLKTLSLEELMDVDVTTVSRHPERASEAPAAVSVITGEDVRRSGAVTIADALRLADGLTVARFNNGTWAISARGFASITADKMLVQIDGRSVYTQLFSGVFWDVQDLLLPDLDRIEVIRGPAGTLWGANAVNGVVNIISKPAGQTQGTLVTLESGTREFGSAGFRYGGTLGSRGHYRLYGKGYYMGSTELTDGS
jgi:iron complex outermembrane receptor protein